MDGLELFTLSNNQQIILEKFSNAPIFEAEIGFLFDIDISDELDFFTTNGLIGIKQSDKSKIFFITSKGQSALKKVLSNIKIILHLIIRKKKLY
ncbi:hypothetical protein [Chryseobacterium sp. P1-3]|uniref:hypothetical protein n=1 Tax=Chryseobacterium sp. (strain P1-3) TaxID=1517683 RepID=UPI000FFC3641|nr:hypothetical protein [Chryseobacterium sp. P1-3]